MSGKKQTFHVQLSPEQFYWALLDVASIARGSRLSREQLGFLFEADLPIALEQVHPVYQPLPDGTVVACALPHPVLTREASRPGVTCLTPAACPPFIPAQCNPSQLNLLTHNYEPQAVRRLRRIWHLQAACILVVCSLLLTLGLQTRAAHLRQQAQHVHSAKTELLTDVLGADALNRPQPPELQLRAELRRLRQTRTETAATVMPMDVSSSLASLFELWRSIHDTHPELYIQTNHLMVTPESITVRSQLASSEDVQHLADGLRRLNGWSLQQPQVNASGSAVQATLQFAREPSP